MASYESSLHLLALYRCTRPSNHASPAPGLKAELERAEVESRETLLQQQSRAAKDHWF